MTPARAADILDFWFGDSLAPDARLDRHMRRWFRRNAAFDQIVQREFGEDVERALLGELDFWATDPGGRLALILLLDQMTRNAFRGTGRAFAGDERACELCRDGRALCADSNLRPIERLFFYLPLLHSERLDDQDHSVACFERLMADAPEAQWEFASWAALSRRQRAVIQRFGRFPSRNLALARGSTLRELAYALIEHRQAVLRRLGRLVGRPGRG